MEKEDNFSINARHKEGRIVSRSFNLHFKNQVIGNSKLAPQKSDFKISYVTKIIMIKVAPE